MTSPKLTLSATTATRAAYNSSLDMADSPPASERLKPQPFRRKDPALHFQACVRGDVHELTKWVKSGGDIDARDESGFGLLHHATVSFVFCSVWSGGLCHRVSTRPEASACGLRCAAHMPTPLKLSAVPDTLVESKPGIYLSISSFSFYLACGPHQHTIKHQNIPPLHLASNTNISQTSPLTPHLASALADAW